MNEEYLKFAKSIAREAKCIMLKYFKGDIIETKLKIDNTVVTKADVEINTYLIERVKENYPSHAVIGEEETYRKSKYSWVCDPLDGTKMYSLHIPVSVFSLALVYSGEPIIGVVYDPFTDNLYSAIKGKGAYRNEVKISVNEIELDDSINSVADFEMWPSCTYDMYKVVCELGRKSYFVNIGSIIRASVAVASGKFTFAIFPGKTCHDIAAVKIIVEEAGGKVTDLLGNEQRYDRNINGAVISNALVHNEIINTVKKFY